MVRDSLGQSLASAVAAMTATGDKCFTIKLHKRFPLLIDALAKVSSIVPHIMPERLAKTDPYKQITEMVGSGPFRFVRDEFQPGHKVVYVKNTDYLPRNEPPSWASGGKIVKVDRVEWLYVPDAATAAAALGAGEVDWWESPPLDYLPVLSANPDIRIENPNRLGSMTQLRFNHLYPPFDNVKMRQAVLAVANQTDFMSALAGDQKNWTACPSFFTCGTPMASAAGSEALTGPRDFDTARRLVSEAGYKNEPVVVLDAVDEPGPHAIAQVGADLMRKIGLNIDLIAADWGTVVTRRASMEPPNKGGWNIFATGTAGVDMADPALNKALRANGKAAWFGWPTDDQLEALRDQWLEASDLEERQTLAAKIQARAFEFVPYIPTGKYAQAMALRANLSGLINARHY
jgi:peptide/nickel transport system substrate-binding protein